MLLLALWRKYCWMTISKLSYRRFIRTTAVCSSTKRPTVCAARLEKLLMLSQISLRNPKRTSWSIPRYLASILTSWNRP
jgi:hypothetical protein